MIVISNIHVVDVHVMQQTRRHILDILKERGEATVDDLVLELRKRRGDNITPVTVRHHLNELLKEQLVMTPQFRHRSAPGRPQHVYVLTNEAKAFFPNNYQTLAANLIAQVNENLPSRTINVIIEGVADGMAAQANIPEKPIAERLDAVVMYLNTHGYNASWEKHPDGFILRTLNCPYHHISQTTQLLCEMDMRMIASLLGVVPRLQSRMSDGDAMCAYLIPEA
jgi:predicted ArsR family transcriptional regulator